jgi:hypothetical protein
MGFGTWIHDNIFIVIAVCALAAAAAIALGWPTGGAFFGMLMGIFLMMKAEADRHRST